MNKENIVEIWKPYPPIKWLYGSNLGNLKTVDHKTVSKNGVERRVEGHDLKQYHNNTGYMRTLASVNGEKENLSVHRVIATCFLSNPENLPQVNHKNCVRDDNRVENLEWCNASYNSQYREKYGISMTELRGRPLFVVILKTGEILRFASIGEASRETGVNIGGISMVIKGKCLQAGGCYFTEDKSEITKEKLQLIKANMHFYGGVIAINLKKPEPLCFESLSEAARQLKCDTGTVSHVISGRQKTAHGYWFCHADENAVENTSAKFGDEIANKVADLMNEKELQTV